MERNNVSKNKMLNELAGNFVQAQEKENPITYSNLTDLELKMKESCIAKIIDEKGEEKYQSDNKSLSKIFEMKMADNPNFNEEYEKYSKADVSLLVLDKEDRKKLAEEINSILEDNKDIIESTKTKDKESNEINDFKKSLIINKVEEYYDKIEPIKLNDDLKDKTKEFSKSIDNVFAIAELYSFKNDKGEDVSTVFKGTIVQKDGEKEFSIKFSSLNDEKTIKSDSLLGLKDKVVNLIEEDKPKYRMSSFEDFKNEKIKEPDIEIENNFKFDFERTMNLSKGIIPKLYTLKIEDENVCKKVEFEDTFYKGFDKLAFALVDKNTAKAFESITYYENEIEKTYDDEFVKGQNKNIVVLLDDKVKAENLNDIKSGIFNRVAVESYDTLSSYRDEITLTDMKEFLEKNIDEKFQLRVDNLKDKEEFLIKNADEFNLTLTEDNRILELNSDDENEYKGNIEDFIKGYKENIKSDFFDEVEEKKEEHIGNYLRIGNYVRDEEDIKNAYNQAILDLSYKYNHNHFYDYQEKIMQNQISLSVDEKIKEYYYDGNKYMNKILEDSKDLSETVSFDEKTFYKELRKFDTSPYEKFSDDRIEITKEKEEIKEKDKTKEKEIEL